MTPINFLKRRVGIATPSDESKPTEGSPLSVKVDDSSMSTSIASTRTEVTVASDFSDETRQDFQRMSSELAFSDDDDDWRNDFLSPGSAISKDLEGRRKMKTTLSPVASLDAEETQQPSSPTSPASSVSESQQNPSEPSNENPPGHVRRSSDQITTDKAPRHNRHRSMTAVAALQTPPRGHRRSNTLLPSGARPPTHRRSSSMNSQKFPPLSPRAPLGLESLYATLEMRMQRFGARHFSVGQTFNLIGNHHFQRQEHDKAIHAYEKALKCNEGYVEPRDSDHIAAAYANIGTVCWKTGDILRSIVCFEKALELRTVSGIAQGIDPEKSLSIAASHHQLGLALSLKQEHAKALDSLNHALRIRESVLGRKNPEVARSLDAIGKIHLFQGKPDKALQCHQEAYAIKIAAIENSLTGERDATATVSLMNIATAHMARKDYKEAIFTYLAVRNAQSLEIQMATMEGNAPAVARLAEAAGETSQMLIGLFTKTKSYPNAQLAVDETLGLYQQAGLKEDYPKMQALKESVKLLEKASLEP